MDSATYTHGKGATFWFTGLSGAGKSTLSEALKKRLDVELGSDKKIFILDGDVIRTGLNKGLGFSAEDRAENIRRISEVSKLFNMAGQIVFVAFISPYKEGRDMAKNLHAAAGLEFCETHISASLEVCEGRDVKGLYAKARSGVIPKFTGISDPFEAPENPDLNVNTGEMSLDQAQDKVIDYMLSRGILNKKSEPRVVDSLVREATAAENAEYENLISVEIDTMQAEYLQTIGDGWAYPLKRFMSEMELLESMQMRTVTDNEGRRHLLSVPITMHVSENQKTALSTQSKFALRYKGVVHAVVNGPQFFENRKEEICTRVFGCMSPEHAGAGPIMKQGPWLVSGESMHFTKRVMFHDNMDKYRYTPKEISSLIKAKNADAVYAFQVRNPLHNGHCLLLNDTRQQLIKQGFKNPILLLHPLGGWCKDDDVPLADRMAQH
jgi:3'-phosphoadenosine 5'-phosphosulfate synthase